MNRHFRDAQYYLKRAAEHATQGVREEIAPIETKVRELTGHEAEPEPGRVEAIRQELSEIEARAEGEAKAAVQTAKDRLSGVRRSEPESAEA